MLLFVKSQLFREIGNADNSRNPPTLEVHGAIERASSCYESLFDLNTSLNEIRVADEISASLRNYEPRISDIDVTVTVAPDTNEMNCTVQYEIVGLSTPPQEVEVLLFPARV